MRYAQGGGLTDERRSFSGKLRLEAAERFQQEDDNADIAHRIKTLIGRRFHKSYTIQGVTALLRRHGWTCPVPARRAIERNEAAVAGWMTKTWPQVEEP